MTMEERNLAFYQISIYQEILFYTIIENLNKILKQMLNNFETVQRLN